jgi:cytochrome oxidase Cu insertion factor (SCO1/SenC/PrrC family)
MTSPNTKTSEKTMQTNTMPDKAPPKGYKRFFNPLLIMFVLFGLPYVLSWYFIYGGDPVSFEAPNNHGELVSPVIAMGEFTLPLRDKSSINAEDLAGNWSLFTVTSSCQKACQETLFTIRQIRKAMGVNRQVIKPIILLKTPEALDSLDVMLKEGFPQLAVVSEQNDSTEKFITAFTSTTESIENSIFMIDPFGNLMMVYPAGTDQKGMLDDLKRLLKVHKPKL